MTLRLLRCAFVRMPRRAQRGTMTESETPAFVTSPILISPVEQGERPFRVVQINGVIVGIARDVVDVLQLAHAAGMVHVDLDDPAVVRWVGGGKYRWAP